MIQLDLALQRPRHNESTTAQKKADSRYGARLSLFTSGFEIDIMTRLVVNWLVDLHSAKATIVTPTDP